MSTPAIIAASCRSKYIAIEVPCENEKGKRLTIGSPESLLLTIEELERIYIGYEFVQARDSTFTNREHIIMKLKTK